MISANNYYEVIKKITIPENLMIGHNYVDKVTSNGADWSAYTESETIRNVIQRYFIKLAPFVNALSQEDKNTIQKTPVKKPAKVKIEKEEAQDDTTLVEKLDDDIRFIKRYVLLHDKIKSPEQLLSFINALQKAILERRIRKTSAYATQINNIQDSVIKAYKNMKGKPMIFVIREDILKELEKIANREKAMLSISLLKRYVNLHGKEGIKDKAAKLLRDVGTAVDKKRVLETDKYAETLNAMYQTLQNFISKDGEGTLVLNQFELNGLEGVLGCNCSPLSGVEGTENRTMSSLDFTKMKFDHLGFTGKWLELIGDPSKGFTAMVFGKPKMGKSYFCIDFAGYLARTFGKVLYVAKEEKLDATFQQKIEDKSVQHSNLFVTDELPNDLSPYDFVFLDSVTTMAMAPRDLKQLKYAYPAISFVYVFQTTKEGKFRGNNEFQHNVDVVIELPEKGKAIQYGRFNQGGEMDIF